MNSRWQVNRIGLLNFWYYDDQEYHFAKGRMLLRGSNGSGKSVTMQSVIPLLLDGNMSPERLDPFGSRDRKMSSYLLEEDDDREERTGYLYLEFCREESETCLTIGMGIRARKGKPLDKWYFSITDGRRIGRDFQLEKVTDEKIPLSKKELENRIQGGGYVFDRQSDYMEYVNRQIFGFETTEEYKELIDLLIQLRTPKLSKDFKPSVINEILSDSLQPLSEDDLRPMSEAIENMDTMSMNLKSRQEAKQAAEKINRSLDKYNRLQLFEKAAAFDDKKKELNALEKEEQQKKQQTESCRVRISQLENEIEKLNVTKLAMEKERESLRESDAVALKEREIALSNMISERKAALEEKEKQLNAKTEQRVETENKRKTEENRQFSKEQELDGILEQMQSEADEMAFEEHGFFAEELKAEFEKPFSFDAHQTQFENTHTQIRQGRELLQELELRQKQLDEQLIKREKMQREQDAARRRVNQAESVLIQTQNEWKEQLYRWNSDNQELSLPQETLRNLSAFAENYQETSDFSLVRQTVADVWLEKKGSLDGMLRREMEQKSALLEEKAVCEEELSAWENSKEPEPERSAAVLKNREMLQKKGIPYQEFYKLLDFGAGMDKTACDRLEEALLHMGILDALVIEEEYKQQVLKTDAGCCDKYLFVKKQRAEKSMLHVLELDSSVDDIFLNQRVISILENIAYDMDGITSVSADGSYQIGILNGTVTGEYEAGFIGTRAREKNRLQKIAQCREKLEILCSQIEQCQSAIDLLNTRLLCLSKEYESLPKDEDLKEALHMLLAEQREEKRLEEELTHLEQVLKELGEQLKEEKTKALKIAEKLYLTCNYDTFRRAEAAAAEYSKYFYQLKSGHELYLQIVYLKNHLSGQLEDLEYDLDQIRYDLGNAKRALQADMTERESILEQLKLTDYEQIKERLDACIRWLNGYQESFGKCVSEKSKNEQQIEGFSAELISLADRITVCRERKEVLENYYISEKDLGYVEIPEELCDDVSRVRKHLEIDCKNLSMNSVNQALNQVYFDNRSFLNDYQITQTEIFEDEEAKRVDIYARYQGVKIPFGKLLGHLEEEIVELQELIKAGDRELFEDILANTMSRKIRGKINSSMAWVEKMNALMGAMNTSSSLKLSLRWRSRTAEHEDQLDTKELVELLKKDYRLMREEEAARLSLHFRSKVEQARRHAKDSGGMVSFYQVMRETLDYRKWFEFQLFSQKKGERQKELTNSVFGTFSGGEKAMSMYVPLFSAVVAKYQGGRADAPRLISLDEAFAGVDNRNIRDMFRLMTEFQFNFIINSQVLWGDCDTLDALAIYQLIRPENAKFVTVMPYLWNGKAKEIFENEEQLEAGIAKLTH